MTLHELSTPRRRPTDVAVPAPAGTHLASLEPDGHVGRWMVRAWSGDGRPLIYRRAQGRLVPMDASNMELHDPPDELHGCEACGRMLFRAQRTPRAVD